MYAGEADAAPLGGAPGGAPVGAPAGEEPDARPEDAATAGSSGSDARTAPAADASGSHPNAEPAVGRTGPEAGPRTGSVADPRGRGRPGQDTAPGPGIRPSDAPTRTTVDRTASRPDSQGPGTPAHSPGPGGVGSPDAPQPPDPARPSPRPAFQPVTIRTARDAVTAAALYLRWLGYRDVRRADQRPPSGIGLTARGVLAQVDPTINPASLRDVECLWLTAMTESAVCVYFSLAGFAPEARGRADGLGIPLFVLDLTGTPQPVNGPARELIATGA
ncbi:hypothetical protein [Streptomyces spongiae]|uniref:hypothetical protein n=1 Tax=Streptomyces spongiae TaxID=565072 RepID=UPI00389A591F